MRRGDIDSKHPCAECPVSAAAVCNTLAVPNLAALRNLGSGCLLRAGQPLFHQGDPASQLFSLTAGVVKLYTVLADGRRQVVAFHFPGEFIAFNAAERYHCTAEAVTTALLCRFHADRFEPFAMANPGLARSRQQRVTHELAATQTRTAILGQTAARERLAHFLCDVHRRTRSDDAARAAVVHLPMLRSDIADYLGLAKETVSRELTALREAGIIRSLSRAFLEILDFERLRQFAQA